MWRKPVEGMENYGSEYAEVPELVMPELISRLIGDIEINRFATYKFGFYKGITLSNSELEDARRIVSECTGLEYYQAAQLSSNDMPIVCDYETFKGKIKELEDMIGDNSNYAYDSYSNIAQKPLTYEEAKEKYDVFIEKDRVSGAYALARICN